MFRLAGHLGKSVRWIEQNISSSELTEWIAYDEYIEPFGGRLLDEQRSVLSMQNYQGEGKRVLKDFNLYDYSMETPKQKEQEQLRVAKMQAEAQAAALKDFFKSKVSQQNTHNQS